MLEVTCKACRTKQTNLFVNLNVNDALGYTDGVHSFSPWNGLVRVTPISGLNPKQIYLEY